MKSSNKETILTAFTKLIEINIDYQYVSLFLKTFEFEPYTDLQSLHNGLFEELCISLFEMAAQEDISDETFYVRLDYIGEFSAKKNCVISTPTISTKEQISKILSYTSKVSDERRRLIKRELLLYLCNINDPSDIDTVPLIKDFLEDNINDNLSCISFVLPYAVTYSQKKVLRLLLSQPGAATVIATKDKYGDDALMNAVQYSKLSSLEVLLEKGAKFQLAEDVEASIKANLLDYNMGNFIDDYSQMFRMLVEHQAIPEHIDLNKLFVRWAADLFTIVYDIRIERSRRQQSLSTTPVQYSQSAQLKIELRADVDRIYAVIFKAFHGSPYSYPPQTDYNFIVDAVEHMWAEGAVKIIDNIPTDNSSIQTEESSQSINGDTQAESPHPVDDCTRSTYQPSF
jgi:hypothetical protein